MIREHQFQSQLENYNPSFFKTLNTKALKKLARDAVRDRDYEGLRSLLEHTDHSVHHEALTEAINKLDIAAVKTIPSGVLLEGALPGSLSIVLEVYSGIYKAKEERDRKAEIYKLLISKTKDVITCGELQGLLSIMTIKELDAFCKSQGINALVRNVTQSDAKPLLELQNNTNCSSVLDLILSRTYSTEVSVERMREVYNTLLKLHLLSEEILNYLGMQIAKNNEIKLNVSAGLTSAYYPDNDWIDIDASDAPIESVIIHELGHWFYSTVLSNKNSSPINEDLNDELIKYGSDDGELINSAINDRENFKKDFKFVFDYLGAAKLPIYKAAKLLSFNTELLDGFKLDFQDEEDYFSRNSVINLFLLSEPDGDESFQGNKIFPAEITIFDMYKTQCFNDTFGSDHKARHKHMMDWASEIYLPQIVRDLNLNSMEVHFLSRIAEYLNRGCNDYDDKVVDTRCDEERMEELIVRGLEFKAANMPQDLVDSFSGLLNFHAQYVSPVAQEQLREYRVTQSEYCGLLVGGEEGARALNGSISTTESLDIP